MAVNEKHVIRRRLRRVPGRLRSLLGRARRRLLRSTRLAPARSAVRRLRPMFGRSRWGSLRFHTVALVVGDHRIAIASARRGALRGDEQALFVYLVSLWQAGDRSAAQACAQQGIARGGDARLRAVARAYEYLDQPLPAQRAVDAMTSPDAALLAHMAAAWRRHGSPERAVSLLERALALDPGNARFREQRAAALGDLRVLSWEWPPKRGPQRPTPEPRRVLHMVERSLPHHFSGSTFRTHYTVRAQRAIGLDAHVVTQPGFPATADGASPPDRELHGGVPYHRLEDGQARGGRVDERLREGLVRLMPLAHELRPWVLHAASDYRNAAVGLEAAAELGIPIVYEVRGFPEEYHRRRPGSRVLYEEFGTRRRIEVECWRRADRIVTLADVMKRHIESSGVDPDRIAVIPNAVDLEAFAPVPRDRALARRLGLEPGTTVLGYVGTFSPYEGIRFLVEAVARLRYAGRKVCALLVGDGPERPQLEQLAQRLKVDDRVRFTGRVAHERLPAYYGLIDIFVVPRTAEITSQLVTPLKPFEAMAMATAVVVSGTEALLEMVLPGETGATFEPESSVDLARVIEELIDDEPTRARLGAQAREWVGANRSWRQNAERYRELYAELGMEA